MSRGRVSATYRGPWSLNFQGQVNAALMAAGVPPRGLDGARLSEDELVELGHAMADGTTPTEFAARIAARSPQQVQHA
jgi:hypothetical protein